jgi:2-amino-4-hydroxy-6-hydroxymethyldihydropteridine diphosphokinase
MALPEQHLVYLSLGSNLGNRYEHLQHALDALFETVGHILKVSSVYETPAFGFKGDAFLNIAVSLETMLSPEDVMQEILTIEAQLGRVRSKTKGYTSRPIDIDILFYENLIIETDLLTVPHPHMASRKFVLQPLHDIGADIIHPKLNTSVTTLLQECEDASKLDKQPKWLKNPSLQFNFKAFNYLAIEGNIGAGKTSLATKISKDYNAKLILERFKDNPFLPKFYEDKNRYAFPLEMSFLADRYQQLADDIAQYDLFTDFIVSDYDVFKSLIFAQVTLQDDEYKLYSKLFYMMYKELAKPDAYIYLYQNTDRLLANIKERGRAYEQSIDANYLLNINKSYLNFIKSQPQMNVKVIDISELDFVNNRADYLKVLREILAVSK